MDLRRRAGLDFDFYSIVCSLFVVLLLLWRVHAFFRIALSSPGSISHGQRAIVEVGHEAVFVGLARLAHITGSLDVHTSAVSGQTMLFDANAAGGAGGSSSYRMPEFIAVILASEGSSANAPSEYLETGGDEQQASSSTSASTLQPPILQPVDGKPRVDSILKWIEEAGVTGWLQNSGLELYSSA